MFALLATTHPLPAPVTVLPAATPKRGSKPIAPRKSAPHPPSQSSDSWGSRTGTYEGPCSTTIAFKNRTIGTFQSSGRATITVGGTSSAPTVLAVMNMRDTMGNPLTQTFSTAKGGSARADSGGVLLTGSYRFGATTRSYSLRMRFSGRSAAVTFQDSNIHDVTSGSFTLQKR